MLRPEGVKLFQEYFSMWRYECLCELWAHISGQDRRNCQAQVQVQIHSVYNLFCHPTPFVSAPERATDTAPYWKYLHVSKFNSYYQIWMYQCKSEFDPIDWKSSCNHILAWHSPQSPVFWKSFLRRTPANKLPVSSKYPPTFIRVQMLKNNCLHVCTRLYTFVLLGPQQGRMDRQP